MKFLLIFIALTAANAATDNILIDWSSIQPIWSIPEFAEYYPKLTSVYKKNNAHVQNDVLKPFVVGGEPAPLNEFTYTVSF